MQTALFLLMLAAPGDVEVMLASPQVVLAPEHKALLGQAIVAVFPAVDFDTAQEFYCRKQDGDVTCRGTYLSTVSEAEYVAASIAGNVAKPLEHTGGQVTTLLNSQDRLADEAAVQKIAAFVGGAFAAVALSSIVDFRCQRGTDEEGSPIIACKCAYIDEVSPPTFVTLKMAGSVIKAIKQVP